MTTAEVTFNVTVRLSFEDEVLSRTQTDDWKDTCYDLDEDEAVEMLARCIGIQGWSLSQLDGWADLPDAAIAATTEIEWEGSVISKGVAE